MGTMTHGVRFKIPLTPFDFAQGRLRQARGERDFESLIRRFDDDRHPAFQVGRPGLRLTLTMAGSPECKTFMAH